MIAWWSASARLLLFHTLIKITSHCDHQENRSLRKKRDVNVLTWCETWFVCFALMIRCISDGYTWPERESDRRHCKIAAPRSLSGRLGSKLATPLAPPHMDGPGSPTHDAVAQYCLCRIRSDLPESDGHGLFSGAPTAAKPWVLVRWHLHLPVQFR
jgi:hypothetical protein